MSADLETRVRSGAVADAGSRHVAFRCLAGLLCLGLGLTGGHLLVTGWTDPLDGGVHRMQDLHWGVVEGLLLAVPLGWQLRRPARHAGAMRVAVLAVLAQLVVAVAALSPDPFGIVLLALVVLALRLHPARHDVLHPVLRPGRLLVVAVPTSLALLTFAGAQLAHHYAAAPHDVLEAKTGWLGAGFGAAGLAFTVLAGALLRSRGATALSAAGLGVLGIGSLLHPDVPSSFGVVGGTLSLLVAVALAGATLQATSQSAPRVNREPEPPGDEPCPT